MQRISIPLEKFEHSRDDLFAAMAHLAHFDFRKKKKLLSSNHARLSRQDVRGHAIIISVYMYS